MKVAKQVWWMFLVLGLATSACGSDSTAEDTEADVGLDAEIDANDEQSDTSPTDDTKQEEEDVAELECDFPTPRLGTDAASVALAANPSRCGQPEYSWLGDASLGDIVDSRRAGTYKAVQLQGLLDQFGLDAPRPVKYDVRVETIVYSTQDRGLPIDATALVGYPTNAEAGATDRDIVMILHGTAGFHDACAPSQDIESQALIALFASIGYVAVAPDYLGLKALGDPTGFTHPYLVGEATAVASIDAARAAGKFLNLRDKPQVCATPRVAIVGGSQGGHAALWVDRIGPMYAPELEIVGTVATVPPADAVGHMLRALQQPVSATGNTIAFLSAGAPWYGHEARLGELLKSPYDETVPNELATNCSPNREFRQIDKLEDVFQPAILAAAAENKLVEPWNCMGIENGLTTTSIERAGNDADSYGVLYVLGENDELVNPDIERAAFTTLCEQGMPLEYLECAGAKHTRGTSWALPEIIDFVDARLAGEVFDQGQACQVTAAVRCRGTTDD